MLYDFSIREEDRQAIIGGLTISLALANTRVDRVMHRLLLKQLYNRVVFGFMTTKEIYTLLVKAEVSNLWSPFTFSNDLGYTGSGYEAYNSMDTESTWGHRLWGSSEETVSDEDDPIYVPFEPDPMKPGKSGTAESAIDTVLGQQMIGRHIYQEFDYFSQLTPNYIEPTPIVFYMLPKRDTTTAKIHTPFTGLLQDIANVANMLDYKHILNPHP